MGSSTFKDTFVVADISTEGLLRLDFREQHGCVMNIANKSLQVDGVALPLVSEGKLGCFRVAVADTVSIPPR